MVAYQFVKYKIPPRQFGLVGWVDTATGHLDISALSFLGIFMCRIFGVKSLP